MDERFLLISARLRAIRKENKFTQITFSDKFGVSQSTYSGYENGTAIPTLEFLMKVADEYNLSMDYLTGRSKDKKGIQADEDNQYIAENIFNPLIRNGKSKEEAAASMIQQIREEIAVLSAALDKIEDENSPDKK